MAGKRSRRLSEPAASTAPQTTDGLLALHRVRFLEWRPSAVTAMRASPDGSVLAVARESGAVEIWETDYWTLVQSFPSPIDTGATSLEWVRSTEHGWLLVSAGLSGELFLWTPRTCELFSTTDSNGGAIWATACYDNGQGASRLAVACDDGCVRLFSVQAEDGAVVYNRTFSKTGGKALSVAWHSNGDRLASGHSNGGICVWEVATGQELLFVTAAVDAQTEMCIWRVLMLPNGDIASGDSSGRVAVWDSTYGTLLAAVERHTGDVMALAASPDGSQLFASGMDPKVALIRRLPGQDGRDSKWVYLDCKRPHTHDVRAMEVIVRSDGQEPLIVSGGNDAQLFCYSVNAFQKIHAVRLCKCPEKPTVQVGRSSSGKSVLLSCERAVVDLWELGTAAKVQGNEGDPVEVAAPPAHILRINGSASGSLTACTLSPDATSIAISTNAKISLFRVSYANGKARLAKVKLPSGLPSSARHLAFSGSGKHLLVCAANGVIQLLDTDGLQVTGTFDQILADSRVAKGASALDAVSSPVVGLVTDLEGKWGAVVCTRTVHLLALAGESGPRYHGRVPAPKHISPISAAAFTPKGDRMVVATAGNHIAMFQVETCLAMPYWHKEPSNEAECQLEKMPGSISGLSFHPTHQRLIAHTSGAFCLIDFDKPMDDSSDHPKAGARRKRTREKPADGSDTRKGDNFRVIHLMEPCLYMGYLSGSDAVLVENPWSEVVKTFPSPVLRHRYGT